jgi:hypothetical protein
MSLRDEPHYRIASSELAAWLVAQGTDRWWSVDGDPLLTGRLDLPCPADELADELLRINQMLLVQDRRQPPLGRGEQIMAGDLDGLASRLGQNLQTNGPPPWAGNRLFWLCWEGSADEWMLIEDEETTESSRADAAAERGAGK